MCLALRDADGRERGAHLIEMETSDISHQTSDTARLFRLILLLSVIRMTVYRA